VHAFEIGSRILLLEDLGLDPFELHLDLVGDATMDQRFTERLIGIEQPGIFADDRDLDLAFRIGDAVHHHLPAREIGFGCGRDAEGIEHFLVETFGMIRARDIVNASDIERLDDGGGRHIAEQRDLAPFIHRDLTIGAA
jgi:hypothetical protein